MLVQLTEMQVPCGLYSLERVPRTFETLVVEVERGKWRQFHVIGVRHVVTSLMDENGSDELRDHELYPTSERPDVILPGRWGEEVSETAPWVDAATERAAVEG